MGMDQLNALYGGVLIGIAVSIMLLFNGRVTGISGILNGVLNPTKGDTLWRVFFISGLLLGGLALKILKPTFFEIGNNLTLYEFIKIGIAGLLVGFGTILGSGCTSGHGICGISRLSLRSIVATLSFIFSGILMVYFLKNIF